MRNLMHKQSDYDDGPARHLSIWRLTPEFEASSISALHKGHTDVWRRLACFNSFVKEPCVLASPGNFLFLLLLFSTGDGALLIDGTAVAAVVGAAVKLSNSFIWTGLALPLGLTLTSDRCCSRVVFSSLCLSVLSESTLSEGFGWTWKKFLSDTGGVNALAWDFLLMGACGSMTMSLADVGMATVEALACSSCIKKKAPNTFLYTDKHH